MGRSNGEITRSKSEFEFVSKVRTDPTSYDGAVTGVEFLADTTNLGAASLVQDPYWGPLLQG